MGKASKSQTVGGKEVFITLQSVIVSFLSGYSALLFDDLQKGLSFRAPVRYLFVLWQAFYQG